MKIDMKKLINQAANEKMKENNQLKPVVELLNRYGIYGVDVTVFLMEMAEATKGLNNDTEYLTD